MSFWNHRDIKKTRKNQVCCWCALEAKNRAAAELAEVKEDNAILKRDCQIAMALVDKQLTAETQNAKLRGLLDRALEISVQHWLKGESPTVEVNKIRAELEKIK